LKPQVTFNFGGLVFLCTKFSVLFFGGPNYLITSPFSHALGATPASVLLTFIFSINKRLVLQRQYSFLVSKENDFI